jgi:multidrug resistance efflux pump
MAEARELINSLVFINNNFDKTFTEYQAASQAEDEQLLLQLDSLEIANKNLQNQLKSAQDELSKASRILSQKSTVLLFGSVGMVNDMNVHQTGQEITLGYAYQMRPLNLFTCYLGLIGNTTIYYQSELNKIQNIGIGLYFGIFIN